MLLPNGETGMYTSFSDCRSKRGDQTTQMPKTEIDIGRLEADFDQQPQRVFSTSDLASFAASRRFDWDLSPKIGPEGFIDLLLVSCP